MLISRNWLQTYFSEELPEVEHIAELLLLHAFEIEGIHTYKQDDILDIDVLPNRAHDCLCHEGIAKELAGLMSVDLKQQQSKDHKDLENNSLNITVLEPHKCRRYTAFTVDGVEVKPSPEWLQEALSSIQQKSINNLVDAGNYTMFDCGQPIHIFDADKVDGDICIRNAQKGEKMTTLTGENLVLHEDDLVIADEKDILALAGVKGGTKAEVDDKTKNIIVEVANFCPSSTRKTSRRVKIHTDSSKRFENDLSPEVVSRALPVIQNLILDLAGGTIGSVTDIYSQIQEAKKIRVPLSKISKVLGITISVSEISTLFDRFAYLYELIEEDETIIIVHVPKERLDLSLPEDIIEELGRWYGYHNIPSKDISEIVSNPRMNKLIVGENTIKNLLINQGYSEVITYSFVDKGEVELYNPIAKDKSALRASLDKQLEEALSLNAKYTSYLGKDRICIFEIGRVYKEGEELVHLSLACANSNKRASKTYGKEEKQLALTIDILQEQLGITFDVIEYQPNIVHVNLSTSDLTKISNNSYADVFDARSYHDEARFHEISIYPFSTRDISLWVDEQTGISEVKQLIEKHAGTYLKKCHLFDEFSKDGRTSFAFSLVFQSQDKTLEDNEVDDAMAKINKAIEKQGWVVR